MENSSNADIECRGKMDITSLVEGLVSVPYRDGGSKVGSGEFVFLSEFPVYKEIWAPELMRVQMSTSFRECKGTTSLMGTWMDFLDREASSTFETVTGEVGTCVD